MVNQADEFKELREAIKNSYKHHFLEAYRLAGGNLSKLAIGLGLSRGTVNKFVQENFGKDYRRKLLYEVNRPNSKYNPFEEAKNLVTQSCKANGVF